MLITGLCLLLVAMLLFLRAPVDGTYITDLFPTMIIFGAGAGVAFPALMMLAMSGATPSDAGLASGLVNTAGQVGGAIGLALLATVSTERTQDAARGRQVDARGAERRLPPRVPDRRAALTVVAIVAAVTVLREHDARRQRRPRTAADAEVARPGSRAGLLRGLNGVRRPAGWRGVLSKGGGGRHCPGVRGTPFRCLLRAFPAESDLGDRFGRSAGYVPGAIPSKVSRHGRGSDRHGEPAI